MFFDFILRLIVAIIAALGLPFLLGGCTNGLDPIQSRTERVFSEVIVPMTQKLAAETGTRTGQLQWSAQGIEPGYNADFEGFWVVGIKGKLTVRAVGIAGQVSSSQQSDSELKPSQPGDGQ